jgi:Mn2+/Fe2+ NRAMP family transporter
VAVLGTTISPYLFFWQAGQEVEEQRRRHTKPLCVAPRPPARSCAASASTRWWAWSFPT